MKIIQVILAVLLGVFIYGNMGKAQGNTLFAYDSLYNAGSYDYILDSLADSSQGASYIKARTLAKLGFPEKSFNLLSTLDLQDIQAASIFYRFGDFEKAINIAGGYAKDSSFQSLLADYLVTRCSPLGDTAVIDRAFNLASSDIIIFKSHGNLRLANYYYNRALLDSSQSHLLCVDLSALKPTDKSLYYFLKSKLGFHNQEYDAALDDFISFLDANYLFAATDNLTTYAIDSLSAFLGYEQTLKLATKLRHSRFGDEALAILSKLPENDTTLMQTAWSNFAKGYYSKASEIFRNLQNSSDSSIRAEAYYGEAVCDYRQGQRLDGVRKLIGFADKYPDNYLTARALFTAAEFYQHGDPGKSIELFEHLVRDYAESRYYSRSLFLLSRLYDKSSARFNALATIRSYGGDGDQADLFNYWSFKLDDADSLALSDIIDRNSLSFYNYKARQFLALSNPDSVIAFEEFSAGFLNSAGDFIGLKIKTLIDSSQAVAYCDSLYKYGLEYEAGLYLLNLHLTKRNLRLDLALLRKSHSFNLDWVFFAILDDFKYSLRKKGFSFSYDTWNRLNYLVIYPEIIAYHSRGNTDPFLALAVIRRESRFNPLAVSNAGALGLMQLMPPTAAQMAKVNYVPEQWIFEPGYNILLGCKYLRWLEARLVKPEITVAAYNAGPSAAKRWKRQAGTDTETYIETISYDQSRNYTRGVIGDFYWYRLLWPSQFDEPSK